jgi:hypothetical protein
MLINEKKIVNDKELKNKIAVILFSTPLFNHVYFFKKKKNKN